MNLSTVVYSIIEPVIKKALYLKVLSCDNEILYIPTYKEIHNLGREGGAKYHGQPIWLISKIMMDDVVKLANFVII